MDKFKKLLELCKCGVYLAVNEYRDSHRTVEQGLDDLAEQECPPEISDEVRAGILNSGNIIDLQFYPDTPIGSYTIIHYDFDKAVEQALECLAQRRKA